MPESVLNSCAVVGDYLERSFVSGSVQRKITDFSKNKVRNIVYRYNVKFDMLKTSCNYCISLLRVYIS